LIHTIVKICDDINRSRNKRTKKTNQLRGKELLIDLETFEKTIYSIIDVYLTFFFFKWILRNTIRST